MGHLMRKLLKKYDSIVVRLGVYIVDLCAIYSHRIIGKLTAFLSHTHNNVKETIFRKIWDLWINGRGLDGKTRSIMIRAGPFTPRECQNLTTEPPPEFITDRHDFINISGEIEDRPWRQESTATIPRHLPRLRRT